MRNWLAADIGGTKLAVAAFDGERLIGRAQTHTDAGRGAEKVIDTLCEALTEARARAGGVTLGVGIACPGPLSPSRGVVVKAPMLGWENVPLVSIVSRRLNLPALLVNDADAAAYGEYCLGAGRGAKASAYITVSTGVGCGLVLNGKVWQGAHESAGELGHLMIERNGRACACGRKGCLETYASGTAIAREAEKMIPGTDARGAAALARAGDARFLEIYARAGDALGVGVAALRQLIDVDRVVLGGSVTAAYDLFAPALIRRVNENSYGFDDADWLRAAALGGDAGLYGAGLLAMENYE